MLGTILGGMVLGGIVTSVVKGKREKEQRRRDEETAKKVFSQIMQAQGQRRINVEPRIKTKVIVRTDPKLEKQVDFFDDFRALDNKLARMVNEGYKGVTYLINGMYANKSHYDMREKLKNIRNYRGRLTHDKKKWASIPAPSDSVMRDLKIAIKWVDENYSLSAKLVYKGKSSFASKNNRKVSK